MDHQRLVDAIVRDSDALRDAVQATDPAARVPACPDWAPMDLLWHVATTQRFWGTIVAGRLPAPPADWPPARPDGDDAVVAWSEASTRVLVDALTGADPADAVWTWSPRKDVGFVARRMVHETAVHRADAEAVAGRPVDLDAELAADGIDEFLDLFLPRPVEGAAPLGGSVHVHCTDADGEWTVRPGDGDALEVTRDHAKADTALRGPAVGLLLALWRRTTPEEAGIDVFGDADLAARFLARTDND